MRGIAAWVENKRITQDTFQSFVCWMLFIFSVVALIIPSAWFVLLQHDVGCSGAGNEVFTIYAHYSTHQWLTDKFNKFKADTADTFGDICYQLIIADSELDISTQPTMWMPENIYWINKAQSNDETGLPEKVYVEDVDTDCINTTEVPFGIITWSKFAKILSPNNEPIPFSSIIHLARVGWYNFSNGAINNYYPDWTGSDYTLTLAHGHPNVTSGGILGLLTGFSATGGVDSGSVWDFPDSPSKCINQQDNKYTVMVDKLEQLESRVLATSSIDLTVLQSMMSRGPEYLNMAYGFEYDVAALNVAQGDQLEFLWNDTLQFVYLDDGYWLTHPLCKLTGDDAWYTDSLGEVADAFIDWISNEDELSDLELYGLRPNGQSLNESKSIINLENGCNPNITTNNTDSYSYPTDPSAVCYTLQYQVIKKPVWLTIVIDVSDVMSTSINDGSSRWQYVSEGLPIFPNALENAAKIDLICFGTQIIPCSSTTEYPTNNTLLDSRDEIVSFFESLAPRTSQHDVSLYSSLNDTYNNITESIANGERTDYHNVILVISEDDTVGDEEDSLSLLDNIGLSFNPHQIRIYPILFYGEEDSISHTTLEEIAARTNGEFLSSKSTLPADLAQFSYYF